MVSNATTPRRNPAKNSSAIKRAFIAAPMSGLGSDRAYKESRTVVLSLVQHLREKYGLEDKDIYYAGKDIDSQSKFSDVTLALNADLGALDKADIFLLYYPVKVASSVLVEAGYALARRKPMILLPKNADDLPYFFKQAESASEAGEKIPLVKICEYRSDGNLLKMIDDVLQNMLPALKLNAV